ncbi:MAG: hypothetical protein KBA28_10580 [Syntrophaceae bacterium]|jgi:hypothetical protein|nr:hypothetical protein [Syntrophaceae bacterium]HOC60549.1 hypothetical protein [Smithellaceae bacterium]HQM46123.1 hypothetical protein [Smithellaceae bacterium]
MPDYWVKISETEEEDMNRHHYLITADDESGAKKAAMQFMARFIDDDENPERIEDGYTFYNKAIVVHLESIKETTKDKFKDFLLKLHTINMS